MSSTTSNQQVPVETLKKIALANASNPYADVTPYELGVGAPIIHYKGFFPSDGEFKVYATPASTFKDKEQLVGYSGKSAGVSVRVAKGVSVRTGGSGGRAIRDTVRNFNGGDLIITNKRIVFVGKDDSFDIQVSKISAVKFLDDSSFVIQAGRTAKNIAVNGANVAYTVGFIHYVQANDHDFAEYQNPLTDEQLHHCQEVRQMSQSVKLPKAPKAKKRTGCLWGVVKGLGILLLIILGIGAAVIYSETRPKEEKIYAYTPEQLLTMENHPVIFDSYEDTEAFYATIGDDRVQVTSISDKAKIERSLEKRLDDTNVLYMTQDSMKSTFIGDVELNIFDSDLVSTMTVEKAVELIHSYLPENFHEMYSEDASYTYVDNDTTVYTYSCRLNDKGIAFHNDGAFHYYERFSFQIYEYENGAYWKIKTDCSAYGGKGLEWIEKFAEPWQVPDTK